MTRSELIKRIAKKYPNMYLKDIAKLVDVVFFQISKGLIEGRRIEIRGFGAFSIRHRKPRVARNPKTNETVMLDDRKTVYFRAGKELKEKVN